MFVVMVKGQVDETYAVFKKLIIVLRLREAPNKINKCSF